MSSKRHYLIRVSYDGSSYYGSQQQKDKPTIEGVLRQTLQNYFKLTIPVMISSRTDRGVHSLDHPILIKIPFDVDTQKTLRNLNWCLPDDIKIISMQEVSKKFHPRFNSKEKTYRYKLSQNINVFNSRYVTYIRQEFDIEKCNEIIEVIKGQHDFSNFTSKNPKENKVRKVTDIKIEKEGDTFIFYVSGEGFLRFMVRNIIACFMEYNEGKISKQDVIDIVNNEYKYNFKKADPQGLCLFNVDYDESLF